MTRADYERHLATMTGHRLKSVLYHELDYRDRDGRLLQEPGWNWCPDFDSLDFGVTFETEEGALFYITWGSQFEQYDLSLQLTPPGDYGRIWNVSDCSRWNQFLGGTIEDVSVYWSWNSLADGSNRIDYPQDILLRFNNGSPVYVSACEIRPGAEPLPMMDHITVFFGDQSAKKYGVGPFAADA